MFKPYGVIPALPTPMKEDGVIDYAGLEKLVDHVIDSGVHGILVGGSNGEYSLMNPDERKEVIKFATEKTDGRVPVIADTECHRTEDRIALTKFEAEVGAENALVINLYYMAVCDEAIYDYYKTVAENSHIGFVIYNYPD